MIHAPEAFLQRRAHGGPAIGDIDSDILKVVQLSYCAGASLVTWETLITLGDEVRYIWTKPNNACAKWLFLFAKWFGFVNQIIIFITFLILSDNAPTPSSTCQALHFYQAGALISLFTNLDVLLVLRVHALYEKNLKCTAFAVALLVIQFVSSIVSDVVALSKSRNNTACIIVEVPSFSLSAIITLGISQIIFISMAFRKRSCKRGNLLRVVVRDSLMVSGAMIGLALLALIYLCSGQAISNVLYPWFPLLPSISVTRLIINMQKAAEPERTVLEFTTLAIQPDHSSTETCLDAPLSTSRA